MQVGHRFSTVSTIVQNEPITGFRQPQIPRHLRCLQEEVPQQRLILLLRIPNPHERLLRHNQHMSWGLWIDVMKRQDQLVLENNPRGNLAGNDLFEEGHESVQWTSREQSPLFSFARQFRM